MSDVVILGLGYIGLPTAALLASKGLNVRGVDINPEIVDNINNGKIHIIEPGLEEMVSEAVHDKNLIASTQPSEADTFLIVVPTPFDKKFVPDISIVKAAAQSILDCLKKGDLIIIESTSPIGTTELIQKMVFTERPELRDKLFFAYCPERVLPGNVIYELIHNDRVIGGVDQESTSRAITFYERFVTGLLHRSDARMAEMCKLVENASRDVQIAFANELSIICDKIDLNVRDLILLANKHPRVNILQPGCGVGGHCIAVDPYFIISSFPSEAKLISSARKINDFKSEWCVQKISTHINEFKKSHNFDPTVALMGMAFKPDIDDLRESPAIKIIDELLVTHKGIKFLLCEPNIDCHKKFKISGFEKCSKEADIVVFLVKHTEFKKYKKSVNQIVIDFCGLDE